MQNLAYEAMPGALPSQVHIAGLRSVLVSRLTGLTAAQLQYWHRSALLEAQLRRGQRGVPRLYSWVDYLRLRIASHLAAEGISTVRIREAARFLDAQVPDWYMLPVFALSGDIATRLPGLSPLLATRAGQFALDWPQRLASVAAPAEAALQELANTGALGKLARFSDAIRMSPLVNLGQPSVRGTSLETRFIAGMAADIGARQTSALYRLDLSLVSRAIAFEKAVAA
jgi:DNA-binding transcriptional MerR regulator